MERSVREALSNNNNNYILPFLWMRGEEEQIIREEIEKIDACGIKAVCLEARPHPEYAGSGWWKDVDVVIDEAKKRGLKIWILDDAHFPTGMANGLLEEKYPERAKKYVMTKCYDIAGPMPCANLHVTEIMKKQFTWMDLGKKPQKLLQEGQELLSVTIAPLVGDDVVGRDIIDVTGYVENGMLTYSFPPGLWRIFVTYTTYDEGGKANYINLIDRESVQVLIEAVYETHYQHYKEEFGKTIAGFFFDEPGMDNTLGFEMNEKIGRKKMALPWCGEAAVMLEERLGPEWKTKLPYLWYRCEDQMTSEELRFIYMDVVTRLYEKNFSMQLGEWCEAHGVESIGHVVEDNNVHCRLGVGPGHFFRSLSGQHMAGIDNIGDGLIPGNPDCVRHGFVDKDGAFSHYALVKMGDAAAQLDPKKKGRLMCETYGAYGWGLGVKNMKWITDYLLVQGVNYLVPHAFSMSDYPDDDCPPHFYARGNNPQFPYFTELMKYANRLCHVFNGGRPQQDVGILYHGELEWMNDCMLIQEPGRVLFRSQIDYTIVPIDALEQSDVRILIIPETEYIDERLARYIEQHPEKKIIFMNRKPAFAAGAKCSLKPHCVASLETFAEIVKKEDICRLRSSVVFPELTYRYYKKDKNICMIMNTSVDKTYQGELTFAEQGAARYDAMRNEILPVKQKKTEKGLVCSIRLEPYESAVLVFGEERQEQAEEKSDSSSQDISTGWKVSLAAASEYPRFREERNMEELVPISAIKPYFSGVMKYEKEVQIDALNGRLYLEAEHLYEAAVVWINGEKADMKLHPPYRFDITEQCRTGKNIITIEVVNTLARENQKAGGLFGPERIILEPSGMFGRVFLKQKH